MDSCRRQRAWLTLRAEQRYDASFVRETVSTSRQWILSGRVQGVGFRWFVLQAVQDLALDGTVRNLPTGQVEVVARGTEEDLACLDAALRQGPPAARVGDVRVEPATLPPDHRGFQVTY